MSKPEFLTMSCCIICRHFTWRCCRPDDPFCKKYEYEFQDNEHFDNICKEFEVIKNE